MQKITLYRYTRLGGGVTVSTVKPDGEHTTLTRLLASEGCLLTDGVNASPCVDTDNPEVWAEVDASEVPIDEEISDSEALAIITGGAV